MIQYSNINDAWGNKDIFKKNTLNNYNNKSIICNPDVVLPEENIAVEKPTEIPPTTQPEPTVISAPINREHFQTTSSCSFAEHLKNCEHCRNSLTEYFENESNNIAKIDIFGLKMSISKDLLKIIFIVIIIIIFILILSMVNISLKDDINTHMKYNMKYYMMQPNIPMYRY